MAKLTIQFDFDNEAVWNRIRRRHSIFLDTNCWIQMADEVNETACRVRDGLKIAVVAGKVFCPVSWGILEELFLQSGRSLAVTSNLMEELSLNACFVMRREVFQWEFAQSIGRCLGAPVDESRNGLFTTPAAFVGSRPAVTFDLPDGQTVSPEAEAGAKAHFQVEMAKIGIVELANTMSGPRPVDAPPAYSEAAKKAMAKFKRDKRKLFIAEASNCFTMYLAPILQRFPPQASTLWLSQLVGPGGDEGWFRRALAELPALYNFVDIMVATDQQPARKDKPNHFMDNEIVAVPLAYADVFVAKDKGIRDLLRNRTQILTRTKCFYCDGLAELEAWLSSNTWRLG